MLWDIGNALAFPNPPYFELYYVVEVNICGSLTLWLLCGFRHWEKRMKAKLDPRLTVINHPLEKSFLEGSRQRLKFLL
jgi:hypothetical protein